MLRTEEEVDKMLEAMIRRSKGAYITQGISFNKSCPRQMTLLKQALMASASFSGLGKELLALRFSETPQVERQFKPIYESIPLPEMKVEPNQVEQQFTKSVGNFI